MYCKHCGKEIPDGSKFCDGCGGSVTDLVVNRATMPVAPNTTVNVNMAQQSVVHQNKPSGSITRLVLGIITTVLGGIAFFQSCAVSSLESLGEALGEENAASGAIGIIVSFFMLAAGIVSIATRRGKAGGIVSGAITLVAALLAFVNTEGFADMGFYSGYCFFVGVAVLVVSIVYGGKGTKI